MIDVAFSVADRLIERASGFAFIGTLADVAALDDVPRTGLPAAYVVPLAEVAGPGEVIGQSQQTHEATVAVLLFSRHAGDATGARATLALHALREAVHGSIVGWTPPGCVAPIAFAQGSIDGEVDGGLVLWRDEFTTQRRVVRPLQS